MSFVARVDGALAGAVLCGTDGRRGYLNHLAVTPPHRRQGIARQLVAACLDALKQRGIARCHTFVYDRNAPGLAFWQAIGWTRWDDHHITGLCRNID